MILLKPMSKSPFAQDGDTHEDWRPPCLSFAGRCVVRITCEGSFDTVTVTVTVTGNRDSDSDRDRDGDLNQNVRMSMKIEETAG